MNTKSSPSLRKRSLVEKGKLHHHYHRRKGSYRYIGKNFIKLSISVVSLGLALYLVNKHLIDIDALMAQHLSHLGQFQIFGLFFLSESFLGLLPPDLFIIWTKSQAQEWLGVGLLASLSYLGGQVSFLIGRWINHLPRFHKWIHKKYEASLAQFQKFGALVIVLGALTPLPFSPISILSGSLEYSWKRYSLLALSRFVRFFIYASFLFKL